MDVEEETRILNMALIFMVSAVTVIAVGYGLRTWLEESKEEFTPVCDPVCERMWLSQDSPARYTLIQEASHHVYVVNTSHGEEVIFIRRK